MTLNAIAAVCVLLIITLFDSLLANRAICLYGWRLSGDQKTCSISCPTHKQTVSNVYCNQNVLRNLNLTYNSSDDTLSMPSGNTINSIVQKPNCTNVTLNKEQYSVTSNGQLAIGSNLFPISNFHVKYSTHESVTFCYPLSPQILQCDIEMTSYGNYKIINNTFLQVDNKNISAWLGDYYILENRTAVTCQQSINVGVNEVPRCNYMTLKSGDVFNKNDGSMVILAANYSIKNPIYSISTGNEIQVCFPLKIDFLNCRSKKNVVEYYYFIQQNLYADDLYFKSIVDPDSYFVTSRASLMLCQFHAHVYFGAMLLIVISICFASAFGIIVTIIIRADFFKLNYHCKCLLCHMISLMMSNIAYSFKYVFPRLTEAMCLTLFSIDYYFMMATFYWLNVIGYDSWRYFQNLLFIEKCKCLKISTCECIDLGDNHWLRFLIYSVYGWGLPAVSLVIVLSLELLPPPYKFYAYKPNISNCFFGYIKSFEVYYLMPITVCTLFNLLFIVLTVRAIRNMSAGVEIVNQNSRCQIFRASLKLVIVLGLCWPIDCLGYWFSMINPQLVFLRFLSMSITSFQGIVISIVVFRKKL